MKKHGVCAQCFFHCHDANARLLPATGCSQEIGYNGLVIDGALRLILDMIERLEGVFQVLVNLEHGSDIATSVAVVRGRPDGDQVLVLEPELVALHDELMGACDKPHIVRLAEAIDDVAAE